MTGVQTCALPISRSGPQWKGIGQAKAVVLCLFVVVLAVLQQKLTQSKEVQQ